MKAFYPLMMLATLFGGAFAFACEPIVVQSEIRAEFPQIDEFILELDRSRVSLGPSHPLCTRRVILKIEDNRESFSRLVNSDLFISRTFLNAYQQAQPGNERTLYSQAIVGLIGYFGTINSPANNRTNTWYFYEALSAVSLWNRSGLGDFNRRITIEMCQRSEDLCFGLGTYRAITFPLLDNSKIAYVQATQATAFEIRDYLARNNSPLANDLSAIIQRYNYRLVE